MSLELLNKRLQYQGGNQQQRLINDKLKALKKALLYSYQAATAILSDGREFKCLINSDKNKPAYDNKIISIPYKDICLNRSNPEKTREEMDIDLRPGDVFSWKQTKTHWLVYLQFLEEDAYFRSEIRRCDQSIKIGNNQYWVYIRGPVETAIEWAQKAGVEWNSLNYSLVMYITADEVTNNYFQRFKTIKILDSRYNKEKTWQVVGVDPYYGDGIIQIFLDEFFENSIQDAAIIEKQEQDFMKESIPHIEGPTTIQQYINNTDEITIYYEIKNIDNGRWYVIWKNEEIDLDYSLNILPLRIIPKQRGTFTLIYRVDNHEDITLDVRITAL